MIPINCDIGERGADHPVDMELMKWIDIANLACGGHAGDERSIEVFRRLADQNSVEISAHLSYPDRKNFGRISVDLSEPELQRALDEQYARISFTELVKFHGALYNDSVVNRTLASFLAEWLYTKKADRVLAPHDSELARACRALGIEIIKEAFAERRYIFDQTGRKLTLVSRLKPYASIINCQDAVLQARSIAENNEVRAVVIEIDNQPVFETFPIEADTICIHSDSAIALELAKALSSIR